MSAASLPPGAAAAGWSVVVGAFAVMLAGFGAIYGFAAFADPLGAALALSRADAALVFGCSIGLCFLVSAAAGPLADRLGPRRPALAGMALAGAGLCLCAGATGLRDLVLGFGVLVGAGVGLAYVPALVAVQRSCAARRGLATALAVSGCGVGAALVPVLAPLLGLPGAWRTAFLLCGVGVLALGCAGALLLPTAAAAAAPRDAARRRLAPRDAALLAGGMVLSSVPLSLPHPLLAAAATDLGLGRDAALGLVGLLGLAALAARPLLALPADRFGRRGAFLLCCAAAALSLLLWAAARSGPELRIFALVFGVAQGGAVALVAPFVADRFGTAGLGGLLGLLYAARGVAFLAAPPAFVAAGGGAAPLLAAAVLGLLGTAMLAALSPAPSRALPCPARSPP